MSTREALLVAVDDRPQTATAVRWAVTDARSRGVPVRLLHVYPDDQPRWGTLVAQERGMEGPSPYSADRVQAEKVLADAMTAAHGAGPGLEITGEARQGHVVGELLRESKDAAAIVLGSRQLGPLGGMILGSIGAAVAARAECPAIVVRAPSTDPAEGAAVVVGVDGTAEDGRLLEYAFDHASRHRVPLRAVLCWRDLSVPRGSLLDDRLEQLRAEAAVMMAESIAGWSAQYPEVPVVRHLLGEHPVRGLVEDSHGAHLLVVGARGRHAFTGTLLGSVSQGVLHHATCPVAVLPVRP